MNGADAKRIEELTKIIIDGTKSTETRHAAVAERNGIQNEHYALRREIIDHMIDLGDEVQTDGSANKLLDTYLRFLDELRDGGSINMFGAAPELADAYALSKKLSKLVHVYWMKTFGSDVR